MACPGTLIIRSDANACIGAGHAMRCLAIGQSWQAAGGRVVFVMAPSTPSIEERLVQRRIEVISIPDAPGSDEDVEHLTGIAQKNGAEWIVVDGYHFHENYQSVIKQAVHKLLLVDDTGNRGRYLADIVLNQNINAEPAMYLNRESYTHLLLGTDYVMLRQEFQRWRRWKRTFPAKATKLLITLGGSDPEGLTLPVTSALSEFVADGIEVRVVLGGSNPRAGELQRIVTKIGTRIQVHTNVTDMAAVMADSDLAIICGGGTLWEALYMGCATISYSRPGVQDQINEKLHALGAIFNLGLAKDFDAVGLRRVAASLIGSEENRRSMAEHGREIVDGQGASRVCQALVGISAERNLPSQGVARI